MLWFAIGSELLYRLQGDWRVDVLKLERRPAPPMAPDVRQINPALAITYEDSVDPEWFYAPPATIVKPSNPELRARTAANPAGSQQENYLWNSALLDHPDAGLVSLIGGFKEDVLFQFESFDGSPFPRFRLYPDNDYQPASWITNHWGWLSVDMTVRKPAHTIRVGIMGDSTSHNTYGLVLQGFLNAWAKARGLGIAFEVANGARQGLGFDDGLAVLKYELGPMGLDYVVEYFGPTFSLAWSQMAEFATMPRGVKPGVPEPAQSEKPGVVADHALAWLAPLEGYSALLRAASEPDLLSEPAKPRPVLHLPLDGSGDVSLAEARRFPYFAGIADRLDKFKTLAQSLHATPLVSTERVCAWDGMKLRRVADKLLFDRLNGPEFWPFSYADVRRMLRAHNGTIAAWAEQNGVAVIDIDGLMPADPRLCEDPRHDTPVAQRMRAWLIFQALVPQIDRDLRDGAVPRGNSDPSGVHPYLDKPIQRISAAQWVARGRTALESDPISAQK